MKRDDEIFAEAAELPAAERPAHLERACAGDPDQRARVEALLRGLEAPGSFLGTPAFRRSRPEPLPERAAGEMIGRYRLVRRIGSGGCGVVYLAGQDEPIRRLVALKVIRQGLDTEQVVARFEAERQALAMMDHPAIAKVLDAGTTDSGSPFFVMEFVDGLPITAFCDTHSLPTQARLELFSQVCLAIQHAHQKGVIHRDLKPSNILVAMRDGVPTPKVIDFGIAKATQGRLTDRTLVTSLEQFLGTPAYMSPEQAEWRGFDIDTRSDVYSLGVVLYELLTGRPPYENQTLLKAGIAEVRRIIREVDPPRPSTRVSSLDEGDRTQVARLRRSAAPHLQSILRGDLDCIVMRCLEKDRERRYGTATELADDLRRHLHREPVVARPPDMGYRVRRFVARHRLACASAAAVVLSLALGVVAASWQAVRAARAERQAVSDRDAAVAARLAEGRALDDARRRQAQAEDLLGFMLGDFRAGLGRIGRLDLLDAVGDKAMVHFAALDPVDLTDTVLSRHCRTLVQIGEIRLDQSRHSDALASFESAHRRATNLVQRQPRNADFLFERAQTEYWLGVVAREQGDLRLAHAWLSRYRDSAVALAGLEGPTERATSERLYGVHNLAVLEFDRGNLAAARAGFLAKQEQLASAVAARPADLDLASELDESGIWLSRVDEADGLYASALERRQGCLARVEALRAVDAKDPALRFRSARYRAMVALALGLSGRASEASEGLELAQSQLDSLVVSDPANQYWRSFALNVALSRAEWLIADGKTDAAGAILRPTVEQLSAMVAAEPRSVEAGADLARALRLEAERVVAVAPSEAARLASQAESILGRLTARQGSDARLLWESARVQLFLHRQEAATGRLDPARPRGRRLIEGLTRRIAVSPNDWRILVPLAEALRVEGESRSAQVLVDRLKALGFRARDPRIAAALGLDP